MLSVAASGGRGQRENIMYPLRNEIAQALCEYDGIGTFTDSSIQSEFNETPCDSVAVRGKAPVVTLERQDVGVLPNSPD